MPYERAELSTREQQMVAKLADACRLMDELFWHQSDLGGWAVSRVSQSPVLAKLFGVMGSRWDLLDDNFPFLGEEPMPPGHELYPYGLTREQIDRFIATHPEMKGALFNEHTVVRGTPDHLLAIPYHEAYAEWLRPMAADLRAAAELSADPAFAKYLRLRADALLSDDYYASDIAWLDLKNPKVDLIFAPYETYLDELLGVKTSYGAFARRRQTVEAGPRHTNGSGGFAASSGRSAIRLPGGGRQSAQRLTHSRGERNEEDLLQELHGCTRE
jgi:hypothetical protein